ncbi:MAG: hypothetical protein OXE43_04635 [Chloroflexi bacterium]|nr:hypothetical protein [Chloroflexota bacterium]
MRDIFLADGAFWEAILESGPETLDDDDPAVVAEGLREPLRALVEGLRTAAPPAAIAEHHAAMLAHLEEEESLLKEIAEAAADGGAVDYDLRVRCDEFYNFAYPPPPPARGRAPPPGRGARSRSAARWRASSAWVAECTRCACWTDALARNRTPGTPAGARPGRNTRCEE